MNKSFAPILIIVILAGIFFVPCLSFGQIDIEKSTKESDRLEKQEEILKSLEPTPPEVADQTKPEEKPAPAKEQTFLIKRIELSGNDNLTRKELAPLIDKYENKELRLSDLHALAKEIEQAYLKQGFIAAAFVPEQEIKGQAVTIRIVESRMGELEIKAHKYFSNDRLKYYWDMPAGEPLRYDRLSRSLQMMNKNPDRKVKAVLRAGKKPGTTDVVLSPETNFPMHLSYSLDGEGEPSTGKYRTGCGLRHNNLLGFDDLFFGGSNFGKNFDSKYAYHLVPVSPRGASVLYGYSWSKSVPKKDYQPYGIFSKSQNLSISLRQDLYREAVYKGEVFAGLDAKDKTVVLNAGTYNRDRLRILRLGGKYLSQDFGGSSVLSGEVLQGLDALGASSRGNPLASRGAKSVFSKVNLGLQHKRQFYRDWALNSKFQSQLSSAKLTPQETFSLGGIDSVRGYPSGDYLADNGFLVSEELLFPAYFVPGGFTLPGDKICLRDQSNLVLFADYGQGHRRSASATEKRNAQLLGLGVGLRIKFFRKGSTRLEWGFPVGDDPITQSGRSYFHFSFDFQY